MGLLLKIALFGVAIYALWKTVNRWTGVLGRVVGRPEERARSAPPAAAGAPRVLDASTPCSVCGAYLSSAATKCGRTDCPLP